MSNKHNCQQMLPETWRVHKVYAIGVSPYHHSGAICLPPDVLCTTSDLDGCALLPVS